MHQLFSCFLFSKEILRTHTFINKNELHKHGNKWGLIMDLDEESKKIISIYEALVQNSEGYDKSLFATKHVHIELRSKYKDKYKELSIIDQITSLLSLIRKRIELIPLDKRSEKQKLYSTLEDYVEELSEKIEYEDGILSIIEYRNPINPEIKKLRSLVYLIAKSLSIFASEEIQVIEKLTDITLRLREKDIVNSADLLESLSLKKMDNITKMTKVRTSLEQTLIAVLESHEIKATKNFFHNLDALVQNSLIKKPLQKSFSKHYSFVSQIIHEEIEASKENTSYGLNIILEIIMKLLSVFKQ